MIKYKVEMEIHISSGEEYDTASIEEQIKELFYQVDCPWDIKSVNTTEIENPYREIIHELEEFNMVPRTKEDTVQFLISAIEKHKQAILELNEEEDDD